MGYLGNAPADQAIQIGSDTILSSHIDDGVIVNDDINASASISVSKTALAGGTGLTLSTNTLNVDAAQTQITSVGTIGTGVWNASVIASAKLDADTAHLSEAQTFTGAKTFTDGVHFKGSAWNDIMIIGDTSRSNEEETHIRNGEVNFSINVNDGTYSAFSANHDGSAMTLGGDFGSGTLTVTPPTTFSKNMLLNPSASTSSYLQFATGGTTYGYVGSESSIVSGGTASDMTIGASGDTNLTLTTNGVVRATLNSSGATFAGNIITTSGSDANLILKSASTRSGIFLKKPGTDTVQGSVLMLADETFRLGTYEHYHMHMLQDGSTILLGDNTTALTIGTDQSATFAGRIKLDTQTGSGSAGEIAHHSNNYLYIRGGTAGLAIGDDGLDRSIYFPNGGTIGVYGAIEFDSTATFAGVVTVNNQLNINDDAFTFGDGKAKVYNFTFENDSGFTSATEYMRIENSTGNWVWCVVEVTVISGFGSSAHYGKQKREYFVRILGDNNNGNGVTVTTATIGTDSGASEGVITLTTVGNEVTDSLLFKVQTAGGRRTSVFTKVYASNNQYLTITGQ